MPWPNHCPDDFREKIESLQSMQYATGPAEIWSVVKSWMEKHDVDPVELPPNATRENFRTLHKTPY